ncbi:MAG TPA: alpha/beta family hydrolase [Gemmatimonadales bacterium]
MTLDVPGAGTVSSQLDRPPGAWLVYLLAHGAGAGMHHPFLERIAEALGARGIATYRYQFPYMERRSRRPDPPDRAMATIRAAAAAVRGVAADLPMIAGGKSFGGRMTSTAQAEEPIPGVSGLVFLGFPLHAPNRVDNRRGAHLADVRIPMLFLQGTRDPLADLTLLRPLCDRLGDRATLHVVDDGDHSFNVRKRSGRSGDAVTDELTAAVAVWARGIL